MRALSPLLPANFYGSPKIDPYIHTEHFLLMKTFWQVLHASAEEETYLLRLEHFAQRSVAIRFKVYLCTLWRYNTSYCGDVPIWGYSIFGLWEYDTLWQDVSDAVRAV